MRLVPAPEGTSSGFRDRDGAMWFGCTTEYGKHGVAICDMPGNLVTPPKFRLIATFESEADRDLVVKLHSDFVTAAKPQE